MMDNEILTEHLKLRPLEPSDVDALHAMWTDREVRRFLWDGMVISRVRTHQIVEKSSSLFAEHGFGIWGVRLVDAEALAGFAGYWYFRTPPELELLFGVGPQQWNRGVATEAARAILHYGFEQLGFEEINASTDLENTASIRVLEKLGMRLERRQSVEGLETVFFKMTRADWAGLL